ncbi:MAG: cyclodeaminase/cyclohydrolase family protein, partial [Bacteroidota bacterium]
ALGTMVANISSHKRGWDDRWEEFSNWAEKGVALQAELTNLVDEDTKAFNKIIEAFRLPQKTDEETEKRNQAIREATKNAIMVPYKIMEKAYNALEVIEAMIEHGNPNSVTDAGVGALAVRSAVKGAFMNIRVNAKDLEDEAFTKDMIRKGKTIEWKTEEKEKELLKKIEEKM